MKDKEKLTDYEKEILRMVRTLDAGRKRRLYFFLQGFSSDAAFNATNSKEL